MMIYLLLSIISSVAIGNLLHFYKEKDGKLKILQVFLGNYFLASVVSFFMIEHVKYEIIPGDLALGAFFGFMFLINFIVFQANIVKNGMAISISVMRISLVIPVILSIIFFHESLPVFKYLGILIVVIAFLLMGKKGNLRDKGWLLALFLITGFTEIGMKLFHEIANTEDSQMLFYLFSSAFIVNLIILLHRREKLQVKYLIAGLVLGVPNQLTSHFFLMGLNSIEAAIAYPFVSSNVVLLGFLSDKYLWKSRFTKFQYAIYTLMLIGVILLNLKN